MNGINVIQKFVAAVVKYVLWCSFNIYETSSKEILQNWWTIWNKNLENN